MATPGATVLLWRRFEAHFESDVSYENPLQDASLQITFVSPSGAEHAVDGFWDGAALGHPLLPVRNRGVVVCRGVLGHGQPIPPRRDRRLPLPAHTGTNETPEPEDWVLLLQRT